MWDVKMMADHNSACQCPSMSIKLNDTQDLFRSIKVLFNSLFKNQKLILTKFVLLLFAI